MTIPRPETVPTHDDSEDYFVPLTDQRVFGAGLKRRRVAFVPATDSTSDSPSTPSVLTTKSGLDVGNKYLSIVLGQQEKSLATSSHSAQDTRHSEGEEQADVDSGTQVTARSTGTQVVLCPVCKTPINTASDIASTKKYSPTPHEASIIHQLHQPHSHPPSHLDRQRKGLKYLQTYGWDPDSRVGLGASGSEGIRVPVKAKEKRDTAGLGLNSRDKEDAVLARNKKREEKSKRDEVVKKLNAKEVRRLEGEKKKRAEKLRGTFYGDDLQKYLGPGG